MIKHQVLCCISFTLQIFLITETKFEKHQIWEFQNPTKTTNEIETKKKNSGKLNFGKR